MEMIVCKNVSNFSTALTRGKSYAIIAHNPEKRQVKIQGDNGRVRWYPAYCFALDNEPVFKVKSFTIDDPIQDPKCNAVEVTLVLTDGDHEVRRWCYFITPDYARLQFERDPMTPLVLSKHGMVIPEITKVCIEAAIAYLENHDLLEECTLPLENLDQE